jgi:hypothetical protein
MIFRNPWLWPRLEKRAQRGISHPLNLLLCSEFCVHDIFCHTTPPNLRQTICAVLSIPLQHIINSPPSITACHPQKSMCSYLSDPRKFELLPDPCELSAPPIGIREFGDGLYVRLRGGRGSADVWRKQRVRGLADGGLDMWNCSGGWKLKLIREFT